MSADQIRAGRLGGISRAKKLTREERVAIARMGGRKRTPVCSRGHSKSDPENQYFNRRRENGKWKAYIECLKCKRGQWKRPPRETRLPNFSNVPPLAVIPDDMPILERWMAMRPRRSA